MSSMDPMRDVSSILSEILQKISLRPYHFKQLANTKSSSSMKPITQQTMYNSYLGRLRRSFLETADSSLPAILKTKLSNPSIPVVPSLNFQLEESKNLSLPRNSSNEYRPSWIRRVLNMSRKFLSNSLTNIFQIGGGSSTNVKGIQQEDKSTQESSRIFRM